MRHSCRFFHIMATCAVLVSSLAAFAQIANPPTPKPTLIVWAHTDLENQGAPTLDLLDLERYFVKQLSDRRVENVTPSSTAKSHPPDPETYLLELSVDAMHPAIRAIQEYRTKEYKEDPVFSVEFSLVVKHPASGRIAGRIATRQEYHLNRGELEKLEPKRAVLYEAADRFADRFVETASEGQFGDQLRSVQLPLWGPLQLWHLVAISGILCIIIFIWIARRIRIVRLFTPPNPLPAKPGPPSPHLRKKWEKQLKEALALALATDNFSDAACWEAAREEHDKILERREAIEKAEAARRLSAKERQAEYLRWHDSGDIQSVSHLRKIVAVALNLPRVKFWLPTREYQKVEAYRRMAGPIPPNLCIRYSAHVIDGPAPLRYGLPVSIVSSSQGTAPAGAYRCPAARNGNKCGRCRACWDPRVRVVDFPLKWPSPRRRRGKSRSLTTQF